MILQTIYIDFRNLKLIDTDISLIRVMQAINPFLLMHIIYSKEQINYY